MPFRLHVVAMPHTRVQRSYSWCAFTNEVRIFCNEMTRRGHHVMLYAGGEATDANVAELVTCMPSFEQPIFFPERVPTFDGTAPGWKLFNARAAKAIIERKRPGDIVCLAAGYTNLDIKDKVSDLLVTEPFVGYQGVIDGIPHAFKSSAWQHAIYGSKRSPGDADGIWDDAVIPYPFEPDEHPLGDGGGGYLLYVGRLIERKGLKIVREIHERTGLPLMIAGFGDESLIPKRAMYVGVVEPKQRAELMGGARCVLMPTLYLEPFGAVAVESQLCGTPVLTTDWGAFPETVECGVSGWRCRSIDEFVQGARSAKQLNREAIRRRAVAKWSASRIGDMYEDWLTRLQKGTHS